MPDRFIIRSPANDNEWAIVKDLLIAYWDEFEDKTCFTSFDDEMSHIQQVYASPDKCKLIAFDSAEDKIAGCIALRQFDHGIAEMKRLYVKPEYRGHRLGTLLTQAILQRASAMGYVSMILDTMTEMKAAQNLYMKMGFHTIPPYHHQDERKIICYEKILTV